MDLVLQQINEVRTEQKIANDANNNGRGYRSINVRISRSTDRYQELMDCLDAANGE